MSLPRLIYTSDYHNFFLLFNCIKVYLYYSMELEHYIRITYTGDVKKMYWKSNYSFDLKPLKEDTNNDYMLIIRLLKEVFSNVFYYYSFDKKEEDAHYSLTSIATPSMDIALSSVKLNNVRKDDYLDWEDYLKKIQTMTIIDRLNNYKEPKLYVEAKRTLIKWLRIYKPLGINNLNKFMKYIRKV